MTAQHPDHRKWRCGVCDYKWKPRSIPKKSLPRCPGCSEQIDVFPADDGVWEEVVAAKARRSNNPTLAFEE